MPYTFPNQRLVTIRKKPAKRNFLSIENDAWMDAAKNLDPHGLMLYLYLASNAEGYELALSPEAIEDAIGMPRTTYHRKFHLLYDKGYVIFKGGNHFEFYDRPQSEEVLKKSEFLLKQRMNKVPGMDFLEPVESSKVLGKNTERNKNTTSTNKETNNENSLPVVEAKFEF